MNLLFYYVFQNRIKGSINSFIRRINSKSIFLLNHNQRQEYYLFLSNIFQLKLQLNYKLAHLQKYESNKMYDKKQNTPE